MVRFRLQVDITVALQHATGMHPSPEEVLISTLYWLALSFLGLSQNAEDPSKRLVSFWFPFETDQKEVPRKRHPSLAEHTTPAASKRPGPRASQSSWSSDGSC